MNPVTLRSQSATEAGLGEFIQGFILFKQGGEGSGCARRDATTIPFRDSKFFTKKTMATIDNTLATEYGLPESAVIAARKGMQEGTHWARDEGGRVSFLPAGLDALEAEFGPKKNKGGTGALEKKGGVLKVLGLMPNVTWARCQTEAGDVVQVRVLTRWRVRAGMRLRCVWEGSAWTAEGTL